MTCRLALLALLCAAAPAAAQSTYDQAALGALLDRSGGAPAAPVRYATYRVESASGNSVLARHELYERIGEGDAELGLARAELSQLLGGPRVQDLRMGETVVLPATPRDFDWGALAYAPYPQSWWGATRLDKVVVVDKTTQTWAAYDRGQLARWGPASTGAAETPTPTGRFTMNWREMERESTEAPPGETWLMRYVMNIHAARGVHLHQYDQVLTGPPRGHGCIRMVTADARWLWDWSDPAPPGRAGHDRDRAGDRAAGRAGPLRGGAGRAAPRPRRAPARPDGRRARRPLTATADGASVGRRQARR